MKIRLIDAHLFYEYLVRQSVCQATKGRNVKIKKHDFLEDYIRYRSHSFFVKICLIDAHLFYEYFVRQSVLNVIYFIFVERFRDFIFFRTFFLTFC